MKTEITAEQINEAYLISTKISLSKLSYLDGVEYLVKHSAMNENSAKDYLRDLDSLLKGEVYKRTMSALSYKIILKYFYDGLPRDDFSTVLHSIDLHLEYRLKKSNVKHHNIRKLVALYKDKLAYPSAGVVYPDEVNLKSSEYTEGSVKQVTINAYERDPKARVDCITKYGAICQVCDFNFEDVYGEIGRGFIHVHHKVDIATIGKSYQVDPINDLVPVCPNCHAMLHTETPAMKIEKLRKLLKS